jgi:hypothetical protein
LSMLFKVAGLITFDMAFLCPGAFGAEASHGMTYVQNRHGLETFGYYRILMGVCVMVLIFAGYF